MRAVITVVGRDAVGILAKVSGCCSDHHINVIEVTQSILQDVFAMIMMVDISGCEGRDPIDDYDAIRGELAHYGDLADRPTLVV